MEPPREHAARESPDTPLPEAVLGGADAVEKSTYLADVHGADVEGAHEYVPVTASVRAGSPSAIVWIAGVLALLALAVYAAGLFS